MSNSPNKVTIWSRTFICITIANITFCFSHFITTPLIAPYATFLGATATLVGILAGLYSAVAFAMRPISGPAMTILNKRNLLIASFAMGILVNMLYAMFGTIPMFIVARVLHGVMYSFIGSLCMSVASDSLPKEKYASGFGIYVVSGVFGQAIGPSVGLALQNLGIGLGGDTLGYRFVFFGGAACYLIGLIPCLFIQGQRSLTKEEKAQLGPWYKSIIALPSLPYAMMMCFYAMGYILHSTYMVSFAEQYAIPNVSIFFVVNAIAILAARPITGPIADKFGPKILFLPGTILFAASMVALALANSLTLVLVAAVLGGLGWGTIQPAVQACAMSAVPTEKSGAAANTNFLGVDFGFFIGPTIAGIVYSMTASYHSVYAFGVVPIFVAFFLYVVYAAVCKAKGKQPAD